jgi:hypothetical protein
MPPAGANNEKTRITLAVVSHQVEALHEDFKDNCALQEDRYRRTTERVRLLELEQARQKSVISTWNGIQTGISAALAGGLAYFGLKK